LYYAASLWNTSIQLAARVLNPESSVLNPSFPMSLSLADVHRIAHLARIEITEEQASATLTQLNDIFAMIERMQQVDTRGVEPMSHPLGGTQRLRADAADTAIDRSENMKNAPEQHQGLFVVPRVIE
jgi:aspartyl-tRNA(Asn)/glutamyl-tRNA(Gln) amidotransferase subunit C